MNKLKVVNLHESQIDFENGVSLSAWHDSDCCESHDLSMRDLSMQDFDGLEFDLTNDNFFKRIEGYGIELIPIHGHSVKIPGYGFNNGYYSTQLELIVSGPDGFRKEYDITECQEIQD